MSYEEIIGKLLLGHVSCGFDETCAKLTLEWANDDGFAKWSIELTEKEREELKLWIDAHAKDAKRGK